MQKLHENGTKFIIFQQNRSKIVKNSIFLHIFLHILYNEHENHQARRCAMTQLDEDMTIIRHLRARIMVLEQENTKMKKELGLLSKIKESQNSTATHAVGIRQWGRGGNAGS